VDESKQDLLERFSLEVDALVMAARIVGGRGCDIDPLGPLACDMNRARNLVNAMFVDVLSQIPAGVTSVDGQTISSKTP
jgi:hypothetical protein